MCPPPGKAVCFGEKKLAPPYYIQCTVFASPLSTFFIDSVSVLIRGSVRSTWCSPLLRTPLVIYVHIYCQKQSNEAKFFPFSALTLLIGQPEGRLTCKKLGVGFLVVVDSLTWVSQFYRSLWK